MIRKDLKNFINSSDFFAEGKYISHEWYDDED